MDNALHATSRLSVKHELDAPVETPRSLVVSHALRLFLTVALRQDAWAIDAKPNEVGSRCQRPAFAKSHVILLTASLVAMAF